MNSKDQVWVVILAAGEGKRVSDLTCDRWGRPAPKQYASIDGQTTLLGTTLERARRIAPLERIVGVVAPQHQRWWARELVEMPPENVIAQPENRGTAAGILLPLVWITRHDPDAVVVILPSDHEVAREKTLHTALTDAIARVALLEAGLVLLGVEPEGPEPDYGWIVPAVGGSGPLRSVVSFREKPDASTTAALLRQGALLNSFILVASGGFLLDLFETALPKLWRSFQPVLNGTGNRARMEQEAAHIYQSVPSFDFSKDVLEQVADKLWVYPVPSCGWLDLGTPERLTRHLIEHGQVIPGGPGAARPLPSEPGAHDGVRRSPQYRDAVEPAAGIETHAGAS